jgi:hypothetical protein
VCHASFSLEFLRWKFWIRFGDGDRPLVFVGHGDGGLVLKQALVKLLDESGSYKDLPSNLCGIVFYGGTNTKLTNKHGPLIRCPLQFKSAHFGRCWPLLDEIKDYSDLECQLTDVLDSNDICTPTSKDDPRYLEHQCNDVMDSDDICTPTSKDDPNYLTLLEFLRQFLPKGLYQTIDDKKVMIFPHQTLNPNSFTLLEFLRQFLPKALYQTIDDKKVMIFPHQTLNFELIIQLHAILHMFINILYIFMT